MKAAKNHQNETSFTDVQLLASVADLFFAGTETTSSSLRYAVLLATHPEIQENMYKEIKNQVGTESLPNYADRMQLPYVEAVVMETQRFADLTPFGVTRENLQPTKLMGYDIPADTVILPFLTNVLHNPDLYPDPQKFNPARFLDSNGKSSRVRN